MQNKSVMNERLKDSLNPASTDDKFRFVVSGIALRKAFRKLKPAHPSKKQADTARATICGDLTRVTIALPGGAVGMPALVDRPFAAELPFTDLWLIATEPYDDAAVIAFEISSGSLCVHNITTRSPKIVVQPGTDAAATSGEGQSAPPVMSNPMDAPIGFPLLAVFAHIRKYGLNLGAGSYEFAQQQMQVDTILDKAEKLLNPLGVRRADIEEMIERRVSSKK
jgi:hypothetical protein